MTIAKKIKSSMVNSSWIRKMFEEGNRLKSKYGASSVFDFSIGNPNLLPPEGFYEALERAVESAKSVGHPYVPQVGSLNVCKSIAKYISIEQSVSTSNNEIVMTCGAAGALNVVLKAILDFGDEVVVPVPCFVEYESYVDNHGGLLKKVETNNNFSINFEKLSEVINDKTKAIIINSPNNPTGHVYSESNLKKLGALLLKKGEEYNKVIYLISDEPYRKLIFDNVVVPSIFKAYSESVIVTSYSKDLSIPGERIGFAAVNPLAKYKNDLVGAMALANRILGFVNAPLLMQNVVSQIQGLSVNVLDYKRKRDILCDGLSDIGYDFIIPSGTFYLFPKTPIKDDVEFVRSLQEELILVVPGSGFGKSGYFRIAFCVSDDVILGAFPGFKKVIERFI